MQGKIRVTEQHVRRSCQPIAALLLGMLLIVLGTQRAYAASPIHLASTAVARAEKVSTDVPQATYVITLHTTGDGHIDVDPLQDRYEPLTEVKLTAVSDDLAFFLGWDGDCAIESTETCTITVDGDMDVTANFTSKPQTWTLSVDFPESGSIDVDPLADEYFDGDEVTLHYVADESDTDHYFEGWGGDCAGENTTTCKITMDSDKSVYVVLGFNLPPLGPWKIFVTQPSHGKVTVDPDDFEYADGDEVTLKAIPDPGYAFSAWSDDCADEHTVTCTLTMDNNKIVGATMATIPYSLTVNTVGDGTVTKSPNQSGYITGTFVTLVPHPNTGFAFDHWSGDCTGSGDCALTITSNKVVTATFTSTSNPSNHAPTFTSTAGLTVTVGQNYTYAIIAADPDSGDTMTITAASKPTWLTLTPTSNGNATLSGVPGSDDVGANAVQLSVHDAANASDSQSFTINVVAANPTTTGTVKGTVVDDKGKPVAGATVTLTPKGEAVTAAALTQVTDSKGNYLFEGVPLGQYTLTVSIDGKQPSAPQTVAVQAGKTQSIPSITLQPDQQAGKAALHLPMLANNK